MQKGGELSSGALSSGELSSSFVQCMQYLSLLSILDSTGEVKGAVLVLGQRKLG